MCSDDLHGKIWTYRIMKSALISDHGTQKALGVVWHNYVYCIHYVFNLLVAIIEGLKARRNLLEIR